MDGTTEENEKWPLISKDFFKLKTTDNEKSMAYGDWSHEDGLGDESPAGVDANLIAPTMR